MFLDFKYGKQIVLVKKLHVHNNNITSGRKWSKLIFMHLASCKRDNADAHYISMALNQVPGNWLVEAKLSNIKLSEKILLSFGAEVVPCLHVLLDLTHRIYIKVSIPFEEDAIASKAREIDFCKVLLVVHLSKARENDVDTHREIG